MNDETTPNSRNIGRAETTHFWITAAEWNGIYGSSYEIGIRNKETNDFTLLQGNWNEHTVMKTMHAVAATLEMAGLAPSELHEVFSP